MTGRIRWYDYLTFNIYWVGLTSLSQTLTPVVLPLLVQQFVGEAQKGRYYGMLRLGTLMTALLVQALAGMLSDRSASRFGRRRPFIVIGTLADLVFISLIGFSAGLSDINGYWFLFAVMILLMFATNTAHAALQGVIPDLVPDPLRGRFSGVKAVLEIPLPLILISFTLARWIGNGNLWGGLIGLMVILFVAMCVALLIPEQPLSEPPPPLEWAPFVRFAGMTVAFTGIILGAGYLARLLTQAVVLPTAPVKSVLLSGVIGLTAMLLAVGFGVWSSLRIGLGDEFKRQPAFGWWVVNRLTFLIGANNLGSFMIYFFQARLGLVREEAARPAATLSMLVGIFILLSALPSGWLADRFGRKKLVGIAGWLATTGTLIALATPELTVIYLGSCILGTGLGLFYSANWALGTQVVPSARAGGFLGIANLAGAGAGAIGAYIGGPIADILSTQIAFIPGIGYLLIFAVYGVLFVLSTLALKGVSLGAPD